MRIKNYTTRIPVEKTVVEIESLLAKYGARRIMKEYEDGEITGLAFTIEKGQGVEIPFRMPVNIEKWVMLLRNMCNSGEYRNLSKTAWKDRGRAKRIGWRVVKDWIDSQLTIVAVEMMALEQVLLPFVVVKGRTLADRFMDDPRLYLGAPKNIED